MKKKILILNVMLSTLLFASCSDSEELQNDNRNESHNKSEIIAKISTKEIAYNLITAISNKPNIATEINNSIQTVTSFDVDENLTFYDILSTENSVFFNDNKSFSNLKESIDLSSLEKVGLNNSNNYFDNLNLYWGYHDSWDGKTSPIICYVDENVSDENSNLNGFKIENGKIIDVKVSEEEFDSELFPVIIVNFNEIDYSRYPDFKNGIRTKYNVNWLRSLNGEDIKPEPVSEWEDPNKIYTAMFRAITSGGVQHDSWICGGSEFKVIAAFLLSDSTGSHAGHSCCFTRKNIKHKSTKYYDYPILHPDWNPTFLDMNFRLIEEDGGSSDSYVVKLNVASVASVDLTIPTSSWDDEIGICSITRDLYFANYIANTTWYGMGDCKISAGLIIKNRSY